MKYIKLFENFEKIYTIEDVVDFISPLYLEDSGEFNLYYHYDKKINNEKKYIDDIIEIIEDYIFVEDSDASEKFGYDFLEENKEEILVYCRKLMEENIEDYLDSDYDELEEDIEPGIDLSIEWEYKMRNLEDDSEYTVDDFFDEFGIDYEYRTDFGWSAILSNAEKYKGMSDEEFEKIYLEYKKGSL